jgi:hypothetical protein
MNYITRCTSTVTEPSNISSQDIAFQLLPHIEHGTIHLFSNPMKIQLNKFNSKLYIFLSYFFKMYFEEVLIGIFSKYFLN